MPLQNKVPQFESLETFQTAPTIGESVVGAVFY